MRRLVFASLLVLGFVGPALAATTPEPRVALVIGNSDYKLIRPLRNPVNDARAMARALRDLGFAKDTSEKANLTKQSTKT